MSVQQAVERRDQETNNLPAQPTVADVVKTMISRQAKAFAAVLPEHLDADRYARLTLVAVKANRKLMACFGTERGQMSVLLSAMQAAALGLEPNTPTQECWLQPRRVKVDGNWTDECELSIGYKGYGKLARRSGDVREVIADVVRQGDDFEFERGLDRDVFRHKKLAGDDAELTHAYAIVRFVNGGTAWVVLNRAQVEKRRAMSESWKNDKARPYSPWTNWEAEQWRKTALKYLYTHGEVPLSPEMARAASSDEQPLQMDDDGFIDALVTDVPELGRGGPASPSHPGEGEPAEAGRIPSEGPPPVPPDSVPDTRFDNKALGALAVKAFPCADAPRGEKTERQKRLRYALTYVATSGEEWHLDALNETQRRDLDRLLHQVIDGTITVTPDFTDDGGVAFTRGDETHTVWWSDLVEGEPEQQEVGDG